MNKKTVFIILGTVILIAIIAISVSIYLGKPITTLVEERLGPVKTETEAPAEEAAETPTNGAPAETSVETPSVEMPEFSSCVILDEEYCGKGEPIYYPEHDFYPSETWSKLWGAGFNLPQGTKIYSPIDGVVTEALYTDKEGKQVDVTAIHMLPLKTEDLTAVRFYNVIIDSQLDKELRLGSERSIHEKKLGYYIITGVNVRQGELLGTIKDESLKFSGSNNEDYNCKITFERRDWTTAASGPNSVPEMVKQYFSYLND